MKRLAVLTFAFLSFSSFSLWAHNATQEWDLKLSSGETVKVTLDDPKLECSPDNEQSNITMSTHSTSLKGHVCISDTHNPESYLGYGKINDKEDIAGFAIYTGNEYLKNLKEFNKAGLPGGGRIGNAVNGNCPSEANALIMISGQEFSDKGVSGYCLIPENSEHKSVGTF